MPQPLRKSKKVTVVQEYSSKGKNNNKMLIFAGALLIVTLIGYVAKFSFQKNEMLPANIAVTPTLDSSLLVTNTPSIFQPTATPESYVTRGWSLNYKGQNVASKTLLTTSADLVRAKKNGGYLYVVAIDTNASTDTLERVNLTTGVIEKIKTVSNNTLSGNGIEDFQIQNGKLYYIIPSESEVVDSTDTDTASTRYHKIFSQSVADIGKETLIASVKNDIIYSGMYFKRYFGTDYVLMSGGDACYGGLAIYKIDLEAKKLTSFGKVTSSCEVTYTFLAINESGVVYFMKEQIDETKSVDSAYKWSLVSSTRSNITKFSTVLSDKVFPQNSQAVYYNEPNTSIYIYDLKNEYYFNIVTKNFRKLTTSEKMPTQTENLPPSDLIKMLALPTSFKWVEVK